MSVKKLAVPFFIAFLTGCATAGSLDHAEPKLSLTSQKTASQVEECISLALSSAGTPTAIRGEGRRILDFSSDGITMWTITISESAPTNVEMRWAGLGVSRKWTDRVRACL